MWRLRRLSEAAQARLCAIVAQLLRDEELGDDNMWRCPKCKDFRPATKTFQLWKLPPNLIVHFKRFRTDAIPDTKMCDECWDPKSINVRRSWRTGLLKRCVLSHYGAKVHVPEIARAHAKAADTALILGTSLSVHPFAKFATMPRRLAIVNLERTRSHDAEERAKVS